MSMPSEIVATVSVLLLPGFPLLSTQEKLKFVEFCPDIALQLLAPMPGATVALNAAIVAAVAATGL
jgi:hypothetical protein